MCIWNTQLHIMSTVQDQKLQAKMQKREVQVCKKFIVVLYRIVYSMYVYCLGYKNVSCIAKTMICMKCAWVLGTE